MTRLGALLLLIVATGCGQKGPLYFAPPAEPEASADVVEDAAENAESYSEPDEGGSIDPSEIDDPVLP